jgi:hypothetical protein
MPANSRWDLIQRLKGYNLRLMCELSKRPTEKLTSGCKDNIKIDALHI